VDVLAVADAVQHRMGLGGMKLVPAHVRDRHVHLQAAHAPGQEAETAMDPVLLALLEQQLHADADTEQRPSLIHRLAQHGHEAAALDLLHGGGKGAVTGQHEHVRAPQLGDVAAEHGGRAQVAERLHHAAEVPDPVIDDRDRHKEPFVLGTSFTRGSSATAIDSARAVALNSVSAMWWPLRPRMVSRWMFRRPWSATAQKKSSNSSVGMVPICRALNSTPKCSQGRPERSITQRERASSRGT